MAGRELVNSSVPTVIRESGAEIENWKREAILEKVSDNPADNEKIETV
jgi:hypothetical protein